MKKWFLRKIIKWVYKGVTEDDFTDLNGLSEGQYKQYCFDARDVRDNSAFKAELGRLTFRQEKYLATKAKDADDLIYGRAVLSTIDMLNKRFTSLGRQADLLKDEARASDENQS